VSNTSIRFLLL